MSLEEQLKFYMEVKELNNEAVYIADAMKKLGLNEAEMIEVIDEAIASGMIELKTISWKLDKKLKWY